MNYRLNDFRIFLYSLYLYVCVLTFKAAFSEMLCLFLQSSVLSLLEYREVLNIIAILYTL